MCILDFQSENVRLLPSSSVPCLQAVHLPAPHVTTDNTDKTMTSVNELYPRTRKLTYDLKQQLVEVLKCCYKFSWTYLITFLRRHGMEGRGQENVPPRSSTWPRRFEATGNLILEYRR